LKYNKFYFLHINKTGGRHIKANVILPIINQLSENGIEYIIEPHSHSGWHSRIDDKTYVMTVLRDPVEQAISLYAHKISLDNQGNLKDEYNKDKLNKKDFFDWMEKLDLYPNFQTRSFLCDEFYLKRDHLKNKNNVSLIFDENILEFRKNQVNLFLNMENINGREIEIQEKIFLDLGINGSTVSPKTKSNFFNHESKILYSKFTEAEKQFIAKYNSLDNDLYKSIDYF
jgi:hypothetical protein